MKIVFIGAVDFSAHCLELLIECQADIIGVCALKAASNNSDHFDLSLITKNRNIPTRYTPDINAEDSIEWIRGLKPDIIFCFGWSRLIKEDLLKLAPMGVVGFHPAALPKNRGRHPLVWPLVLGLDETGSTFFFMDEGADSGDILSQFSVPIYRDDDVTSLYERVTEIAAKQIKSFLPLLQSNSYQRRKQDNSLASVWRKRGRLDGQIDWRMSAEGICNLVRGLSRPYIGAHFICRGVDIKVWRCGIITGEPSNLEPGKIVGFGPKGPIIKAGVDAIELIEIDSELELSIGDYL
jgi:methionyl-tRNA formyltransferase